MRPRIHGPIPATSDHRPGYRLGQVLRISADQTRLRYNDNGFSLIELLIVITILPLIVGALALGLVSVFSLQSGVASRLSNTGDAQVVSANYQKDVQGAAYVTTSNSSSTLPVCGSGTGTQLLGLESNNVGGVYQTIISYVSVPVNNSSSTTYSLVRLYCTGGGGEQRTPSSEITLASNLPRSQPAPTISCIASLNTSSCNSLESQVAGQWVSTQNISVIIFPIAEPETANKTNYTYTLTASPEASTSSSTTGSPITALTTTNCNFGSAGTGTWATNLCLVDFSFLTGSVLTAAENGCVAISVNLTQSYAGYILNFCISITNQTSTTTIQPSPLPTYYNSSNSAFLGATINGTPYYTGVTGEPALYQHTPSSGENAGTSIIDFNDISVESPSGSTATGWDIAAADAESTDDGESITWTTSTAADNNSGPNLTVIPNDNDEPGISGQTVGNACQNGAGLTGSGSTTVECTAGTNESSSGIQKTGAAMVEAPSPSSLQVTMVGAGLQAIAFGMFLP